MVTAVAPDLRGFDFDDVLNAWVSADMMTKRVPGLALEDALATACVNTLPGLLAEELAFLKAPVGLEALFRDAKRTNYRGDSGTDGYSLWNDPDFVDADLATARNYCEITTGRCDDEQILKELNEMFLPAERRMSIGQYARRVARVERLRKNPLNVVKETRGILKRPGMLPDIREPRHVRMNAVSPAGDGREYRNRPRMVRVIEPEPEPELSNYEKLLAKFERAPAPESDDDRIPALPRISNRPAAQALSIVGRNPAHRRTDDDGIYGAYMPTNTNTRRTEDDGIYGAYKPANTSLVHQQTDVYGAHNSHNLKKYSVSKPAGRRFFGRGGAVQYDQSWLSAQSIGEQEFRRRSVNALTIKKPIRVDGMELFVKVANVEPGMDDPVRDAINSLIISTSVDGGHRWTANFIGVLPCALLEEDTSGITTFKFPVSNSKAGKWTHIALFYQNADGATASEARDKLSSDDMLMFMQRVVLAGQFYGLEHNDLHLGNVMRSSGGLTLIDYGRVVFRQLSGDIVTDSKLLDDLDKLRETAARVNKKTVPAMAKAQLETLGGTNGRWDPFKTWEDIAWIENVWIGDLVTFTINVCKALRVDYGDFHTIRTQYDAQRKIEDKLNALVEDDHELVTSRARFLQEKLAAFERIKDNEGYAFVLPGLTMYAIMQLYKERAQKAVTHGNGTCFPEAGVALARLFESEDAEDILKIAGKTFEAVGLIAPLFQGFDQAGGGEIDGRSFDGQMAAFIERRRALNLVNYELDLDLPDNMTDAFNDVRFEKDRFYERRDAALYSAVPDDIRSGFGATRTPEYDALPIGEAVSGGGAMTYTAQACLVALTVFMAALRQ